MAFLNRLRSINTTLNNVTVLGAGTMGAYISFRCAQSGCAVRLFDHASDAFDRARTRQREWALNMPDAAGGKATLDRIRVEELLEQAVAGADLVIEALPEDLELKRQTFAQLDALCSPTVILASNSSSLRMSRIETGVRHRERVANLHFFLPPARAIEIMGGTATSAETLGRLQSFARSLDLVPFVLRGQSTGFLYNRIWRAIKREVLHEVAEGVATPEEIDRIVMMAWGWDKGPFGWMDAVGLDVVRDIENVYFEESGDPKDRPPAYLDEMIARGELGVKSGKGFYTYPHPAYEQPGWIEQGPGNAGASKRVNRADFVGTWRLVSFESVAEGQLSHPYGQDARGYLIYTPTNRMSVVLSKAKRAPFEAGDVVLATSEEKAAAFDSCLSYFGTFKVADGRVIHCIEHCTLPNWIGTDQVRFFEFNGHRLTLTTPPILVGGREAVSRLVWERIKA